MNRSDYDEKLVNNFVIVGDVAKLTFIIGSADMPSI